MARKRTDSKENAAQIMAKSAVPITVPTRCPSERLSILISFILASIEYHNWTKSPNDDTRRKGLPVY